LNKRKVASARWVRMSFESYANAACAHLSADSESPSQLCTIAKSRCASVRAGSVPMARSRCACANRPRLPSKLPKTWLNRAFPGAWSSAAVKQSMGHLHHHFQGTDRHAPPAQVSRRLRFGCIEFHRRRLLLVMTARVANLIQHFAAWHLDASNVVHA
jgi:hypothetical protein